MCSYTRYKVQNPCPKSVPAALSGFGISCRLQVSGRGNKQQPIIQQLHSEHNYLCKSVSWLSREKYKSQNPAALREMAYKTLVRPVVEYSSSVWSPYTKSNVNKFEMIQRRVARWTSNNYSPYASVTEMLQSLGWRSLEQRTSDSRLCLFYKIIYGLVAIDMPPYVLHPSRILRNSHPLGFRQIQTTVDYYKYSLYLLAIVQWNRLPSHIALLPTFDSFRRAVCTVSHSMP